MLRVTGCEVANRGHIPLRGEVVAVSLGVGVWGVWGEGCRQGQADLAAQWEGPL